jgi:hypothetical protein
MTFDQKVIVIYMLDDKIKMKQAVYFIVRVTIWWKSLIQHRQVLHFFVYIVCY